MNQGAYYILMNDIILPHTYQPLTTLIGGLDGNNKKIIINTNLAFESNSPNFGIFNTIGAGALVRNLNIEVRTNINITLTKQSALNAFFGILAGQNNGNISNVSVKSLPNVSVKTIFLQGQNPTVNHVAGLVGQNSGYITHSRVSIDLYSSSSVSGFVGTNNGKIANSYVHNSLIVNTSVELENKTAGFVVNNIGQGETGGKITSSYVSGAYINSAIYANNPSKIIQSSRQVGGFVYENSGFISNSYSNIPIITSSTSAGFVYINSGIIKLTYSSSQLKEASTGNYGFIFQNTGKLENNHFLQNPSGINSTTNPSNMYDENSQNNVYKKEELLQLSIVEFTQPENFKNYVFTLAEDITKGTWFMPRVTNEAHFNNPEKTFTIGRPELVGANLLATSEMEIDFDLTFEDEATGEITYAYRNVGEHNQGSIYNPFLISTAREFESKIAISGNGNLNTNNFRLIADIDYNLSSENSNLYNMIMVGDIEGNGMEVKGYVINTSASLASAGLFSKIGNGSQQQGTVKNLTLKPSYVNLPNTNTVGALAGTIDGGTVFNITVDGRSGASSIIIVGKNLVGGVFGRAENNYKMNTIKSTISVHSTYRSPKVLGEAGDKGDKIGSYFLFRAHTKTVLSKLSYAGGVVGVLAGTGSVENIVVENAFSTNAEWSALMFGGVGNAVRVKNINAYVSSNQAVQGAVYTGVVAAEFYGNMENVNVISNSEFSELFKTNVYKPYAIGGVIGLMGTKENITSGSVTPTIIDGNEFVEGLFNVSIKLNITAQNINVVGGVVGQMLSGKLDDVKFVGSVQAREIAGGMIGRITQNVLEDIELSGLKLSQAVNFIADLNNLKVLGGSIRVDNDNLGSAVAGGLVGQINVTTSSLDSPSIIVKNSSSQNEVRVISVIYGQLFDRAYAGGLIGQIIGDKVAGYSKVIVNLYDVKFDSRLVMILRDLNLNSLELRDEYSGRTGYGFIIGNVSDLDEIEIHKELVEYENNGTPIYITSGEGIKPTGNYFLLSYNYLGVPYNHSPLLPDPLDPLEGKPITTFSEYIIP
jgi:hypothetical protein